METVVSKAHLDLLVSELNKSGYNVNVIYPKTYPAFMELCFDEESGRRILREC